MRVKFFLSFFLLGFLFSSLQVYATDTDGDGISDADEIAAGYNPNLFTRFVYVDGRRQDDSGNGLTSATAKKTFDAAITISKVANQENVILAAAGTYTGNGNKNLSFGGYNIKIRSLNGAAATIIDLENDGRFLSLNNGETLDSLLDGFTVRNGSGYSGGAVYLGSGAGLKIKNCVFENTVSGNAVSVDTGITEITNSRFLNNASRALLLCQGEGSIVRDCEFSKNKTNSQGAAISIYDCEGTVEITRCKFMYNQSFDEGGAIFAFNFDSNNNAVNITNCLFLDNRADAYNAYYACYNTVSHLTNVTIANTKYSSNYSCRLFPGSSTTLQNCIIQGSISIDGAVVANNNCSQDDLSSRGSNNITVDPQLTWGGYPKATSPCINAGLATGAPADDLDGTARPVGSSVDIGCYEFKDTDNDGLPDAWETANGLNPNDASDVNLTATGNDLTNLQKFYYNCNPAVASTAGDNISDGVKIANGYNPILPIRTAYVDNVQSDDSGNGLTWATAKKTIHAAIAISETADYNNVIMIADGTYTGSSNKNLNSSGFDIRLCSVNGPANAIIDLEEDGRFLDLYSHAWVEGLTIRNGWADEGGAIFTYRSDLKIKNCVFENNVAGDDSGAILMEYGTMDITDSRIVNSSAPWGGAIFAYRSYAMNFNNCEFSNNSATNDDGGAIVFYFGYGNVNVSQCKFMHNQSDTYAGAVIIYNEAATLYTFTNCLFLDNTSDSYSEFFSNNNTVSNFMNVTFAKTGSSSGDIFRLMPDTSTTFQNCVIQGTMLYQGTLVANNNCSPDNLNQHGSGNITSDPLLTLGGYLKVASPCIDAGLVTGAPTFDLDDIERPVGNGVDMGCYEFKDSDGDGIPDGWEIANGLNPLKRDTDGDGTDDDEFVLAGGGVASTASIRYYYDGDDRLIGTYAGSGSGGGANTIANTAAGNTATAAERSTP